MTDDELLARADAIAARAYAPYSNFSVGCAVLCRDGTVIEGVNVENGAYPLGVCAERTAFSRAMVEGYRPGDFVVAAVKASPCGGCRQGFAEMGLERVVFRNGGRVVEMTVDEILPEQFALWARDAGAGGPAAVTSPARSSHPLVGGSPIGSCRGEEVGGPKGGALA